MGWGSQSTAVPPSGGVHGQGCGWGSGLTTLVGGDGVGLAVPLVGWVGTGQGGAVTLRRGAWRARAPVVEGTAHHGVLAGLQHDVTVDELLDRTLAVRQETAQAQAAAAAKGRTEYQHAQVQEVAVHRVGAPAARRGSQGVPLWAWPAAALARAAHLLPSWNRANSRDARSSTVSAVTPTGPLAERGKQPCTRASCQSECALQMSTESKYLGGERAPAECTCPSPALPPQDRFGKPWTPPGGAGPQHDPGRAAPWLRKPRGPRADPDSRRARPGSGRRARRAHQGRTSEGREVAGAGEARGGRWAPPLRAPRYLMKSPYSIQKTPSLLPCGMSSPRRFPGQ